VKVFRPHYFLSIEMEQKKNVPVVSKRKVDETLMDISKSETVALFVPLFTTTTTPQKQSKKSKRKLTQASKGEITTPRKKKMQTILCE
jgi:hypothetical protein